MNGRPNGIEGAEAGLTLAETVVALGIFGFALLGLNVVMVSTLRTSEFARDLATARFLAEQRLEQIKAARYVDGDRDGVFDPSAPCTDIDEITSANFPDEDYGEVDLRNGLRFAYRDCAAHPDIRSAALPVSAADYPDTAQGRLDRRTMRERYARFRREVYIVDSADYDDAIRGVSLDGPAANARDHVLVDLVPPGPGHPATDFVKYVLVRVKWKDGHGKVHHVTLSTQKTFAIPAS